MNASRNPKLKLVGIFGYPLKYTLSPLFQNAGFKKAGLAFIYKAFPIEPSEFLNLINELKTRENFMGGNVTIPHKQLALQAVDELDEAAKSVGAVNTIYRHGKKWAGSNTDVDGFIAACEGIKQVPLKGARVLVLGNGGSARAVAYGCLSKGASQVRISGRNPRKVSEFCESIRFKSAQAVPGAWLSKRRAFLEELHSAQWLVNTLPPESEVGSKVLEGYEPGNGGLAVMDISYRPIETALLKKAKALGLPAVNGLKMLFEQGTRSFERWTGKKAPRETMWKVLEKEARKNYVK